MERERMNSYYVDMSSHKNYLELTNVVFAYNTPNLNKRQINYGTTEDEQAASLEKAKTLLEMPVYAKCKNNMKGQASFGSHEARKRIDGTYEFDTIPIGVHTSVKIEDRDVLTVDGTVKTLPALVATERIWKRNKNAVAAIERLFPEGKLVNSWELDVSNFVEPGDGLRYIKDYEFLGNCFMASGESAIPAYPCAQILEVSADTQTEDCEMMVAEALSLDFAEQGGDEVTYLKDMEKALSDPESTETAGVAVEDKDAGHEDAPENSEAEKTEEEFLKEKKKKKILGKDMDDNGLEDPDDLEEDDAAKKKKKSSGGTGGGGGGCSSVAENAAPVGNLVEEPENSSLTDNDIHMLIYNECRKRYGDGYPMFFFPENHTIWWHKYNALDTQFMQAVYEINGNELKIVSEMEMQLEIPDVGIPEALAAKDNEIKELTSQVNALSDFKEKYESAQEKERAEKHAADVAALQIMVENAGCFSKEEIASQTMKDNIQNLRVSEVKAAIYDKKMATPSAVEASSVSNMIPPRQNLEADAPADRVGAMRRWLGR